MESIIGTSRVISNEEKTDDLKFQVEKAKQVGYQSIFISRMRNKEIRNQWYRLLRKYPGIIKPNPKLIDKLIDRALLRIEEMTTVNKRKPLGKSRYNFLTNKVTIGTEDSSKQDTLSKSMILAHESDHAVRGRLLLLAFSLNSDLTKIYSTEITSIHRQLRYAQGLTAGILVGCLEYILSMFDSTFTPGFGAILFGTVFAANQDYHLTNLEILARMAQLKNYFGFTGGETFTRDHYHYARENYAKDIVFDNNMSDFFSLIPEDKIDLLIKILNTCAI